MSAPGGVRSAQSTRTRIVLRRGAVAASVAVLALLFGCVAVPTAGPIRKVEGQQPRCQNCVTIEVKPPAPGDDPRRIVEGYLLATSNYQPNYSVARMFLTREAATTWSPEARTTIYRQTSLLAAGSRVLLQGEQVGELDEHRSYKALDTPLWFRFQLTKEDGEWRIFHPPEGLLVTESSFSGFYTSYSLHFISNGHLVPDPIYLPTKLSRDNIASALIKALLAGPSTWLKPGVTSAIPPTTTLSGDAVTITDGVATVPLNDPVLKLNEEQRVLMAAQVLHTLQDATGVKRVLFTVNSQPLRVPGGDEASFVVAADAIPRQLDPVADTAGEQLFAVRNGAVQVLPAGNASPEVQPVPGALGKSGYEVNSVAIALSQTDLAVVTNNRTVLRLSKIGPREVPRTLLRGQRELLRPQFSRDGELWAVTGPASDQRMWVFADGKRSQVAAGTVLGSGGISAFRISPDGARIALIRKLKGRTELGLARIERADKIAVEGWQRLDTTESLQMQLGRLRDVAWINATELMVLGSASDAAVLQTYRISQDASTIMASTVASRDAVELTVRRPSQTAFVVGANGQTYRNDDGQWIPFVKNLSTIAYPG
jgi:Lipoprotein LpqB beta-propeller domain/Sporulation and spore germination